MTIPADKIAEWKRVCADATCDRCGGTGLIRCENNMEVWNDPCPQCHGRELNLRKIARTALPELLQEREEMDLLDLYDRRLATIDGDEAVYTTDHLAAKKKARAALEGKP